MIEPRSEPTLRVRRPAYAAIRECLWLQAAARPRGAIARFLGRSPLNPDARSWYRGAIGELEVSRVLEVLGTDWTVIHDVPMGANEPSIDHLAIGPGGVFTINSTNHSGARIWASGRVFLVNGFRQNHLRTALAEAERVARLLANSIGARVQVTPLIIVVDPASITIGAARPLVSVLAVSALYRFLHRRRRDLSAAAIAELAAAASEYKTWQMAPLDAPDSTVILERFSSLQREVEEARIRAFSWSAVGFAAAAIPGVAFVATTVVPIWRSL